MMASSEFKKRTTFEKCGRGGELRAIDSRLEEYEANNSVPRLIALLSALVTWKALKDEKMAKMGSTSGRLIERMSVVNQLLTEVIQNLADGASLNAKAASFAAKKAAGQKKELAALQPGYAQEKIQYQTFKTTNPTKDDQAVLHGASLVSESMKNVQDPAKGYQAQYKGEKINVPKLIGSSDKDLVTYVQSLKFDKLSSAQFELLHAFFTARNSASLQQPDVYFFRKTERIERFLTYCVGGLFYKQAGVPYTTTPSDMYAMDKYGNLMTMPSNLFMAHPGKTLANDFSPAQCNHSSLNAGHDVISAGIIEFQAGLITKIDNHSGHYKPTPKQLQNAIRSLSEADNANLSTTSVGISQMLNGKLSTAFCSAAAFLIQHY